MARSKQACWTEEQARTMGRLGGLASGRARRDKKTLREALEVLLDMPCLDDPGLSNREAVAVALLREALKGEVKAFAALRDTLGEKPSDKQPATPLSGAMVITWQNDT